MIFSARRGLASGQRDKIFSLTCTTTASALTLTITGLTVASGKVVTVNWGDGSQAIKASKNYSYSLDKRCSYYNRDEIEILFKDKKGSFQSFTFQLRNEQNTEIKSKEFKKQIGSYKGASLGWTYNTWDRGRTVFDVDTQDSWVAVCDWITSQDNIDYLRTLFSTAEAYWVVDQDENIVLPIVITSKSYKTKKIINERLVNAEITFELAYNQPNNI